MQILSGKEIIMRIIKTSYYPYRGVSWYTVIIVTLIVHLGKKYPAGLTEKYA